MEVFTDVVDVGLGSTVSRGGSGSGGYLGLAGEDRTNAKLKLQLWLRGERLASRGG
jgi:hypothetical protein